MLIDAGDKTDGKLITNCLKHLGIEKIEINDIIKIGEATAIVKWVDNEEKYSDNNLSIVLQLNYKDKKDAAEKVIIQS